VHKQTVSVPHSIRSRGNYAILSDLKLLLAVCFVLCDMSAAKLVVAVHTISKSSCCCCAAYHDIAEATVLSIVDYDLHKISLVLVPPVLYVRDPVGIQVS
jgi:hypothetical protein